MSPSEIKGVLLMYMITAWPNCYSYTTY